MSDDGRKTRQDNTTSFADAVKGDTDNNEISRSLK